jgi:putative ABC transport system permease protein
VVGRRSSEIATIKALGMERGQTVRILMIESAILGAFGSVFGVILGELLSLVLSATAGGFVARQLEFHLYFQPIWMGLVVGIVTAVVFGLLPAYSASKIPPAQVLRQKTNALPHISFIATALIIGGMALIMGLLAGVILDGQFVQGIVLAFATLVACSLLVFLFSGILWVVGKLPLPLGLNYKMARRNLSRSRAKNATTMLVMLVGIFSVALVIILASSLKDTLKTTLENSYGYNLSYSSSDKGEVNQMTKLLTDKQVPGVANYVAFAQANVRLISGGGVSAPDLIARKLQNEAQNPNQNQNPVQGSSDNDLAYLAGISPKDVPGISKIVDGAIFESDNQVIISKGVRDNYGLKIGDKLVYQDLAGGQPFTLTITGISDQKNFLVSLGSATTTYNLVQTLPGNLTQFNMNIDRNQLDAAKAFIQTNMGKEPTDLSFITNIFNQLIDQVTAFPILLALLSLIAGGVLIANNVALAVLERRTEMGVMKTLGAESRRVFQIITWETTIVAFLGAVLGFALAYGIASALVGVFGSTDNPAVLSISPLITFGILTLAVGLSLLATFGSAWGASREKPLVVLRYE